MYLPLLQRLREHEKYTRTEAKKHPGAYRDGAMRGPTLAVAAVPGLETRVEVLSPRHAPVPTSSAALSRAGSRPRRVLGQE